MRLISGASINWRNAEALHVALTEEVLNLNAGPL